jgi:hypothetical protein
VTFRINRTPDAGGATIRIAGRIRRDDLDELKTQLDAVGPGLVLDVGEVSLASVEVIRFLGKCEARGIQLLNCSSLIRKWIDREMSTA